ncbi:hypothetical protein GPECTOR_24g170 [Gonium pectorale]|uniref:GATA-type domain-containing protein n=1 Tax=Gonium pectorale TaxID=33097 RepID=A0A150GGB4_GONPE|nr:hypothetical protein GPECTOR_24g170 [Gonium pectorale]|eukprot:KXZ48881.1 hypothetical protein GPECTOR_24g170 [Gonium pectorale]
MSLQLFVWVGQGKVKWFERRVNLEPSTKGIEESEREVFELEDTDVNPIGKSCGCISGKCRIVKAHNYEEAFNQYGSAAGWFFCRGYFQQSTNSFVAYTPTEMASRDGAPPDGLLPHPAAAGLGAGAGAAADGALLPAHPGGAAAVAVAPQRLAAGMGGGVQALDALGRGGLPPGAGGYSNGDVLGADEEPEAPPAHPRGRGPGSAAGSNPPPSQQQPASKRQKATGRTCMECGATSTPQWREGPAGPKTLCNACGVRYVRSQQKAAGQKRSSGGAKNGQGRLQGSPNAPSGSAE